MCNNSGEAPQTCTRDKATDYVLYCCCNAGFRPRPFLFYCIWKLKRNKK